MNGRPGSASLIVARSRVSLVLAWVAALRGHGGSDEIAQNPL